MSSYRVRTLPADVTEAYWPMIYSRWLRSLRYGNDFYKLVDSDAYYEAYHRYIGIILQRSDTRISLASLTEDDDVVLGFSVHRNNILDYVHVHKDQRRLGIGTKLVPRDIDTITHLTRTGLTIWGSKYFNWKFNPFA